MEIFVVGSLSYEDDLKIVTTLFSTQENIVRRVRRQPDKSIDIVIKDTLDDVSRADKVIAVAKPDGTFGEGTTYVMEFAKHIHKPVIYIDNITGLRNSIRFFEKMKLSTVIVFPNAVYKYGYPAFIEKGAKFTSRVMERRDATMNYFLAVNNKQLGVCLRMLFAEGIQGSVQTVLNEKSRIEFHIYANADEPTLKTLMERYRILVS